MTDANTPRTAADVLLDHLAKFPALETSMRLIREQVEAIEAEASGSAGADRPEGAAAPTPAEPLTGEALYRLWWQAAWDAMDNPRQWEQLSKDERGVWRMTADRLAAARPETSASAEAEA